MSHLQVVITIERKHSSFHVTTSKWDAGTYGSLPPNVSTRVASSSPRLDYFFAAAEQWLIKNKHRSLRDTESPFLSTVVIRALMLPHPDGSRSNRVDEFSMAFYVSGGYRPVAEIDAANSLVLRAASIIRIETKTDLQPNTNTQSYA